MKGNNAQKEAISHDKGPCIVIAGPGSGKTFTIVNRIDNLITVCGVKPEEILVITFSKAASLEMKERFEEVTTSPSCGVTFGTFHGVFFGILKGAGVIKDDSLLSEREKELILREVFYERAPGSARTKDEEHEMIKDSIAYIAQIKNGGKKLDEFQHIRRGNIDLCTLYEGYESLKDKRGKIDFEDMITKCYDLFLDNPDILKRWQETFCYILVDEFQDINKAQYEIIKMLALPENNLFVVGDDDQSIYGFRGARPAIMQEFVQEYKDARRITLSFNYRSTPPIVRGAARVISHNRKRFKKELIAVGRGMETVHVQEVRNAKEEAQYIVEEIKKAIKAGILEDEIAIIYRTGMEASLLVDYLHKLGISYRRKEYIPNLYEHFIAKDIFSYLRIACGSRSREDFLRIANKPLRYLTRQSFDDEKVGFEKLKDYYKEKDWMQDKIAQMEWDIKMLSKKTSPYLAISYIRHKIGYEDYLRKYSIEKELEFQNFAMILDDLSEMSQSYETLQEWICHVENRKQEKKEEKKKSGVYIQSIHASKGLEYQLVIVMRANETVMPYKKARRKDEIEEERRLFYVAMTRAKHKLIITYIKEKNGKEILPSRFVGELLIS